MNNFFLFQKYHLRCFYITALVILGLFPKVNAQNVLVESFNYLPGGLVLNSNSSWAISQTGTPIINIIEGNLSYPKTISSISGNKVQLTTSGQGVRRLFTPAATLNATTTPAIYASLLANVTKASEAGDYFFSLGSSQNANIYIKANGSGFSFGVGKTASAAEYETTVRSFNTTFFLVLKYEFVPGNTNDLVKLYVNPDPNSEPTAPTVITAPSIADVSSFNALFLLQKGNELQVDGINIGTTWNSITQPLYDYGDAPISYDTSKDGVVIPALHTRLANFYLGKIIPDLEYNPNSVAQGTENNTKGDNSDNTADEDAIDPSQIEIRAGVPTSISVSVNNTSGNKYLYGWIDFNNNGRFESTEAAAVVTFSTAGKSTQVLTWTGDKTSTIPAGTTKLYMRLRLSDSSLIDQTGGTNADFIDERSIGNGAIGTSNGANKIATANGEVEDYQINVINTFDYGDVPTSYEMDINNTSLPAKHAPLDGFTIGSLLDVEAQPASVATGTQNNTLGDNAVGIADEDGITDFLSVSKGAVYSISVPVNVPSSMTKSYIYAWLDLNGDGRFQTTEIATASPASALPIGQSYVTFTWTAAQTKLISDSATNIYLRIRLADNSLFDFTTITNGAKGADVDERSIGNGATSASISTNSPIVSLGEVEDYQLPVNLYDFGDVPPKYENNVPARQISNPNYLIGNKIDAERAPNSVTDGEDNNADKGDNAVGIADEDGLSTIPSITKGTPFSFTVPLSVPPTSKSNAIAWIDFNNNGIFEESEVAYIALTGTTNGYQSITGSTSVTFYFRGSQTVTIPAGVNNVYVRIRLTETAGADTKSSSIDERSIADGLSSGIYGAASIGEVEDYRFPVVNNLFDFGDVPKVSYEMNKDGNDLAVNYRPARNMPSNALFLGKTFDVESDAKSVAAGADNNGSNGDGLDEDGLQSDQLYIQQGAINTFNVAVNNATGSAATLYGWIDFNNNGRFENTEVSNTVSVASNATSANISFTAAQINSIPSSVTKLYMRLRLIQPESGVTIADLTNGTNATVVDERSIADGTNTGEYGIVSLGEVEDYQLSLIRDYGDVPVDYENGDPAYQTNTPTPQLTIGDTIDYEFKPASVTFGDSNNGSNGDGLDEDGIKDPDSQVITNGAPFSVTLPINSTVTGQKYLYGWIDFNGDKKFSGNEFATVTISTKVGVANNATLTWSSVTLDPEVIKTGKVYVRFRLSTAQITNSNSRDLTAIDTRSYGGNSTPGEIEDYQFPVSNNFDYGDAPKSYSWTQFGEGDSFLLPPRQAASNLLRLGATVDTEASSYYVEPNADNNGSNGDGLDEDGVTRLMPIYKGVNYSTLVSVMNNTGSNQTLYGWIDFNNNGRFESRELATVVVNSSTDQQNVVLTWTTSAYTTSNIPADATNLYMRLRISSGGTLMRDQSNATVDERALGDGLIGTASETIYGAPQIGEVEDYRIPISTNYDYGDLPDSYDTSSRVSGIRAARQIPSASLFLGDIAADGEANKLTSSDALGDDNNNLDDEDGVSAIKPIFGNGGYEYSINVKATNYISAVSGQILLYGWIDFNNDGIFGADEMASVAVKGQTSGNVALTWTAKQSTISGTPTNGKLNMRLRITQSTVADYLPAQTTVDERSIGDGLATGEYATLPSFGEIEDYQIPITTNADFGDAPPSYEYNAASTAISQPARHSANLDLILGKTIDTESAPHSVAKGADNNGSNGDGLDEDGITQNPLPTLAIGSSYSVPVNVTNNLSKDATLYAWIDFNGDGKFSLNEYIPTAITVKANSGSQTVNLTWPSADYIGTDNYTYIRLRLTTATLTDDTATSTVDERAIADGDKSGVYTSISDGEVEDYYITIQDNSGAVVADCNSSDDRLGVVDPIQASFHSSIVKTASGEWLVFGEFANPTGSNQTTPLKVIAGQNGFNFNGTALIVTGSSNAHQYFLLSTAGLYTWGTGTLFNTSSASITKVALPPGVGPANVQLIDAGNNAKTTLSLLTKNGNVWIYTGTTGDAVQGDGGNTDANKWHQVMIDETTPLTGMKDIKCAGGSVMATDGAQLYTWGNNVYLGDGTSATNKSYATLMTLPSGLTTPIKQQDLSNKASTSYHLRDSAGKVFVLGSNYTGQLGVGNTIDQVNWINLTTVSEQPNAAGVQTNVQKPLKKVIWISASNHDNTYPSFSIVTEENRVYSTGGNDTGKLGIMPTNTYNILTAVTESNGARMLSGKMIMTETGGHISVIVKDRSDRYGYTGHTASGSDGCGCTNNPKEFTFDGIPSTGPVCGNVAYDYGDLPEDYNLGGENDMASHQIKYSQDDNPLKLGKYGADSDDGPTILLNAQGVNEAKGDDMSTTRINDEDAFLSKTQTSTTAPDSTSNPPKKTAGSDYVVSVPLTNNTGKDAYLYAFVDWNNNNKFEPTEAIVTKVSSSATEQSITLTWKDNPSACNSTGEEMMSYMRLRLTTQQLTNTNTSSTDVDTRSYIGAPDGEVEDYYVNWTPGICGCYKTAATSGDALDTTLGISTLKRGVFNRNGWPQVRKGGWLAMEAKTKGFVINRMTTAQVTAIANPVEGMMVFDTTENCLKIYTTTDSGKTYAWKCFKTPACPE